MMTPSSSTPRTLLAKIWDEHEILRHPSGPSLLYIDRDMIHEGSFHAFADFNIISTNSSYSIPKAFACAGKSLSSVIPGKVFTSRTKGMDSLEIIISTLPKPEQFKALNVFNALFSIIKIKKITYYY